MSFGGDESDAGKKIEDLGTSTVDLAKPLIEQASKAGQKAQDFATQFFDTYVKDNLVSLDKELGTALTRNTKLYNEQMALYKNREAEYQGTKDLISSYADTIRNFDAEGDAQRTSALALGDLSQSRQANDEAVQRALATRGINPNSGAGVAGARAVGLNDALARASIMQNERNRAENLGRTLQQSGAEMALRMRDTSGLLGATASTIGQGMALPSTALSATSGAGALPLQGIQTNAQIASGLGTNLYTQGTNLVSKGESMNAEANKDSGSGFGALAGTVVGGLGGFFLGGPAGALQGAQLGAGVGSAF